MPRIPRVVVAGVPLHVVQRGHNRMATFQSRDDFAHYGALLREASIRARCDIHAYVFMSNHVHLLVTPHDRHGTASMMHVLGTRYARYFNHRYDRTGSIWENRYWSTPVDSGRYLFTCSRYIELNPVRAAMVDHPSRYEWSSFRCNTAGTPDALVTPHPVYEGLAHTDEARRVSYAALFAAQLDDETLSTIRRATRRGMLLGDTSFRERLEAASQRSLVRGPWGGDRRSERFRGRRSDDAIRAVE